MQSVDSEDVFDHDLLIDEKLTIHSNLLRDIELFQSKYGKHAVNVREFPSLNTVHIDCLTDVSFLNATACAAWRVKKEVPLIVRLKVEHPDYYPGNTPQVQIFQPITGEENENSQFKDEYGVPLSKKAREEKEKKQKSSCGISHQLTSIASQFLHDHWSQPNVASNDAKYPQPKKSVVDLKNPQIISLIDMGFSPDLADKGNIGLESISSQLTENS